MRETGTVDADKWIARWDLQQNAHIRNREERFQFMFSIVEHVAGRTPNILDLACGPGSLSRRFLDRFPGGSSVAVDYDPVLLHFARNSKGYDHGRVTFVEANLASDDWFRKLPVGEFDAIMSTTALHWLPENSLKKLYNTIFELIRQGGVFLNGDHLYPEGEPQYLKDLFRDMRHSYEEKVFSSGEALNWTEWWEKLAKEESLSVLIEERTRRYPHSDSHNHSISLETHEQFLRDAGFHEVGVGWQDLDNRVLIASKR